MPVAKYGGGSDPGATTTIRVVCSLGRPVAAVRQTRAAYIAARPKLKPDADILLVNSLAPFGVHPVMPAIDGFMLLEKDVSGGLIDAAVPRIESSILVKQIQCSIVAALPRIGAHLTNSVAIIVSADIRPVETRAYVLLTSSKSIQIDAALSILAASAFVDESPELPVCSSIQINANPLFEPEFFGFTSGFGDDSASIDAHLASFGADLSVIPRGDLKVYALVDARMRQLGAQLFMQRSNIGIAKKAEIQMRMGRVRALVRIGGYANSAEVDAELRQITAAAMMSIVGSSALYGEDETIQYNHTDKIFS